MGKLIDLTGKKFGRLEALRKTDQRSSSGSVKWLFKCECGNEKIILGKSVTSGAVKSCGCLHSECAKIQGKKKKTHGMKPPRLYAIWNGMKSRCYNKNNPKYKIYGARGVEVCKTWKKSFVKFRDWALSNGYSDKLSIDRINVDGNYEPDNCRWATQKEQQRNRRNNHIVIIDGKEMCLARVAERYGVNSNTLRNRIRNGIDIEEAIQFKHGGKKI